MTRATSQINGASQLASQTEHPQLISQLKSKRFELSLSVLQNNYYWLERKLCQTLMRRPPPTWSKDPSTQALLNLGCGPHIFPNWVNADDYAFKRWFRERTFRPNWRLDITNSWRCPDNYWDGIFSEHVIEHVTYSEAIFVLTECFRTLKPGAWIRLSVPDLKQYVDCYLSDKTESDLGSFPHPAVMISFLAQMHLHRSLWDSDLMVKVVNQVGFVNATTVAFGEGTDRRLVKDDPAKQHGTLYVEAKKPC
jgi:predicted SAM-dependent methyltransferase